MGHNSNWTIVNKIDGLSLGEINTVLRAYQDNPDLGSLCKHNNINPWAKYKPFRDSALYYPTASDWQTAAVAARYGFGQTETEFEYGWNQASPEWVNKYLKPRGGTYDEPYRALDFADITSSSTYGYNHNAVPPIAIDFMQTLEQGNSGVSIRLNGYASNQWDANTCISFSDLFPSTLSDYKFAVLLIFQRPGLGNGISNLIVSNYGPGDVSGDTTIDIPFAGVESNDHIFTPIMAGTLREGDTVTVKVGLVDTDGWSPDPSKVNQYGYVYAFNGDPTKDPHQFESYLVSLNVQGGMDSAVLTYMEANSIYGLEGEISASVSRTGYTYMGSTAYTLNNVTITLDKTGCVAWGDRTSVNVQLFINAEPDSQASALLYYGSNLSDQSPQNLYGISHDESRMPVEQYDSSFNGYSVARLLNSSTSGSDTEKFVTVTGGASNPSWATTVLNMTGSSPDKTLKRAYIAINQNSWVSSNKKVTISGYVYSGTLHDQNVLNPQSEGTVILLKPCTIDLTTLQ